MSSLEELIKEAVAKALAEMKEKEKREAQERLKAATELIAPVLRERENAGAQAPFDTLRELALRLNRKGTYSVYVIMLEDEARSSRYIKHYGQDGMPWVYVGQTGKSVAERYEDHEIGWKSRAYIGGNLIGLLPGIYERYNPLPNRDTALVTEAALAEALRQIGCTVFGGH